MNAPLYENGAFGDGASLMVALVIGVAFGWFLERGGLGNARKLAGQFQLTDMTVLKVMFSAIVTAMLGLFWLDRFGVVDAAQVYVPATYVLPQAAGGVLFGIGFATCGLCPGTSCVAASSGRKDGLAVMLGMGLGIVVWAEAFPMLGGFWNATPLGHVTFARMLGVPAGILVAAVTGMALAAFAGAEWIERRARGGVR